MKKIGWLSLMLCLALCLAACASPAQQAPELLEPVGVQMDTAQVKRGDICDMTSYEFAVVPRAEKVFYVTDGTLDEVCVVLGQKVAEGDVLLKLDVEAVQEQLDELNASIRYIEQENALTLRMLELDVAICESEMGDTRSYAFGTKKEQEKLDEYERVKEALKQEQERQALQMQQLEQQRRQLAERVENSQLKAPCAGHVAYIAHESGTSVRGGNTAMVLAVDDLLLRGEYLSEVVVDSADEITALVGDTLYPVEYLPLDSQEYISMILSGAQMDTEFAFANGAPAGVKAGDYALILVKTKLRQDVLYLPPNALQNDAAGYHVYRADGKGGRERVEVTLGTRVDTAVEIKEGLQEGDEVYVP